MADEEQLNAEQPSEAPAPSEGGGRMAFLASLLFVALACAGIFSYASEKPVPWMLGGGLMGWGLMDLLSHRRRLAEWKGVAAWMNILHLVRWLFFVGLGGLLIAQSLGLAQGLGTHTLLLAAVSFLVVYFVVSFSLEMATRSRKMLPQALLLLGLALQFVSFLYFSVAFTVSWAAVFCCASFTSLALACWRGALRESPSVAPSVGLLTLLLGAPFSWFFLREVLWADLQPVQQASLFVPRYYELQRGLSPKAGRIAWAPGNTQPGLPGTTRYSDKIALVDERAGKLVLNVFLQRKSGAAFAEAPLSPVSDRPWWSPDSNLLAATGWDASRGEGTLTLYQWGEELGREKGLRRLKGIKTVLQAADVMPQREHGQIWTPDGSRLYYAGPASARQRGGTALWRAGIGDLRTQRLTSPPSKIFPAVSPDGTQLLYVTEKGNQRYLEIGDTEAGLRPRVFHAEREAELFPAWNKEQTQVLYLDKDGRLMIMSANNRSDARPLTPALLRSRIWKGEETGRVFTLQVKETGELRQVWTMNAGGGGAKKIYESVCSEMFPPQWSADSSRICLVERDGPIYTVLAMGRDGAWPRRFFVTRDPVRQLQWSPDSSRLAWLTDRKGGPSKTGGGEVWTAERESLNPQRVFASSGTLDSLTWSPLGQHLAFEEKTSYTFFGLRWVRPDVYKTWVYDLKMKRARSLTAGGVMARQPSFSPQGVMLAYLTDQASSRYLPGFWSLSLRAEKPAALAVAHLF